MYYFINDRINNQDSSIEFCTTLYMIWYYFTNTPQGYQFRRFRNIIIGPWMTTKFHTKTQNSYKTSSTKKKYFGDLSVLKDNKHTLLGMNIDIKYNIIRLYMV